MVTAQGRENMHPPCLVKRKNLLQSQHRLCTKERNERLINDSRTPFFGKETLIFQRNEKVACKK